MALWTGASKRSMYNYYDRPRSGIFGFILFFVAVALGAGSVVLLLRHAHNGVLGRIATALTARQTSVDLSVPVVVEKIQKLNRLETVVYSLDTVVEGDKSAPLLPDMLGGDKLLMIVHGQSIAGVDLSQLKPEDVRFDGKTIHLNLPASQVFVTTLDNQHSKVYMRSTGLLVQADPNLETQVRIKAEQQLQQAAIEDGILDAARKNATSTLTTLLYTLGYEHVDVK